jgi:hypothetical protein
MTAHRVLGLTAGRAFHARKCPRCNEAPSESRGCGSSSTVSGIAMSGERSTIVLLMDHIPRCSCSWCVIHLHDQIVHVLYELMLEAGATKGRNLLLEVRRIWSGDSPDRHGDVGLVRLLASHRHLVVDVTFTSARTNTNAPHIGARLPIPGSSLALGAEHGKLDADLRTSAFLWHESVQLRLDENLRDFKLLIITFWNSNRDTWSQRSIIAWS